MMMAENSGAVVDYQLAETGARVLALLIDGAIVSMVSGVGYLTVHRPDVLTTLVVGLAYSWFFLTRNNGQTPGKMLMHLRVIKADGSPITDADAVTRWLGYLINNVTVIGWAWVLFDDRRQGWHDKLAGTYVVKTV